MSAPDKIKREEHNKVRYEWELKYIKTNIRHFTPTNKVYLALMEEKPKMDKLDKWAFADKKRTGENYSKVTAAKAKCHREAEDALEAEKAKKAEEDEKAKKAQW